jgi:hypothetical protein
MTPVTVLRFNEDEKMATNIAAAPNHTGSDREQRHLLRRPAVFFLVTLVIVISALFGCGGAVTTTNVQKGRVTLQWSAPTTNEDGTQLTDLAGYKVYYGTTVSLFTSIDIGNVNSYQVIGLTKGQSYYFALSAYNKSGTESNYSNIVSKIID